MLLTSLDDPDNERPYFQQISFTLEGRLNSTRLKSAFLAVVIRHPVLRAAFVWEGVPHAVQFVRRDSKPDWREEDWRSLTTAEQRRNYEEFLARDREQGFDFRVAPLMRLALFQLEDNRHQFTWSLHHSLVDGWSVQRLLDEFFTNYRKLSLNQPLSSVPGVPFARYIAWRETADFAGAKRYWSEQLAGLETSSQLQLGQIREDKTLNQNGYLRTELQLGKDRSAEIRRALGRQRVTLGIATQAAWACALGDYCNSSEVVFGVTVSGRPLDLPGAEEIIGPLLNTVPVRISLEAGYPIAQWLKVLQEQQIQRLPHETLAPAEISRLASMPAGVELIQSILVLVNYPKTAAADELPDLQVGDINHEEKSHYPLACIVVPDDDLQVILIANDDLIAESRLQQLAAHFAALLEAIALSADARDRSEATCIAQLPTAPSGRPVGSPPAPKPADSCLPTILQHCVERPESIALHGANRQVSWAQLDEHTAETARGLLVLLAQQPVREPDEPILVGIELPSGVDAVLAIIAVLRAGFAYVPLDPDYPAERRTQMRKHANLMTAIVQTTPASSETSVVTLRELSELAKQAPGAALPDTGSLAYVLYTSGSTGTPLGVMVSHRNLAYSTSARSATYPEFPQRYLLLSSISFDSSVAGIFWTLACGGTLVLPRIEEKRDPRLLSQLIHSRAITHLLCIPSLYRELLLTDPALLGSLELAILAGEVLPPDLVATHYQALPECNLVNEYGPTEATVWCSLHRCDPQTAYRDVPIGLPIPGTELYITNENQREVPSGVIGELCVSSDGVALGYLHEPELSAQRFTAHPTQSGARLYRTGDLAFRDDQGEVRFVGRRDSQAKILGKRIDLSEIEAALHAIPGVAGAGVTLVPQVPKISSSIEDLTAHLQQLPPDQQNQLLRAAEECTTSAERAARSETTEETPPSFLLEATGFRVAFNFDEDFIATPRPMQREWLIHQQVQELKEDLQHLNRIASTLAPGAPHADDSFDISQSELSADRIMEDWQTPLMQAMVDDVTREHGDVLEIGFGRGISAQMIQAAGVRSHTIIESNDHSVNAYFRPWLADHQGQDIRLVHSRWQDALGALGTFDGVFFHTYPMNVEEFVEHVAESATYAEHFFATAAQLLRPGGVFVYLTTEIDSLSRRHQRALFKHFSSFNARPLPLEIPEDVGDAWWSDSMIVLQAFK